MRGEIGQDWRGDEEKGMRGGVRREGKIGGDMRRGG